MTPKNLTAGHLLAFLYYSLANIDNDPTEDELAIINIKLREWGNKDEQNVVTEIMKESLQWYLNALEKDVIATEIASNYHLFDDFTDDNKMAVLRDLAAIIIADGKVDPREDKIFALIADSFGIELK